MSDCTCDTGTALEILCVPCYESAKADQDARVRALALREAAEVAREDCCWRKVKPGSDWDCAGYPEGGTCLSCIIAARLDALAEEVPDGR